MDLEVAVPFTVAFVTQVGFCLLARWFRDSRKNSLGKTVLSLCVFLVVIVQLTAIALSPPAGAVLVTTGIALNVLAVLVYFWARRSHGRQRPAFAGLETTPSFLTQCGPYRVIRHPFYASYLLAWLAGPILAGQPWLFSTTLLMIVVYYLTARQEEQWFQRSPFAEDYRHYSRRTGMFVPSPAILWRR